MILSAETRRCRCGFVFLTETRSFSTWVCACPRAYGASCAIAVSGARCAGRSWTVRASAELQVVCAMSLGSIPALVGGLLAWSCHLLGVPPRGRGCLRDTGPCAWQVGRKRLGRQRFGNRVLRIPVAGSPQRVRGCFYFWGCSFHQVPFLVLVVVSRRPFADRAAGLRASVPSSLGRRRVRGWTRGIRRRRRRVASRVRG